MLDESPGLIQSAQYDFPYHHLPRLYRWNHLLEYEVYLQRVVWWIRTLAPDGLLDVGCGDGRLLREVGWGYGVDLEPRAIRWAKAVGVKADCLDARGLTIRYGLVTAVEVLEHIPPPQARGFVRTLAERSNGMVLITVPTTNVPVPSKHYRHFDTLSLLGTVSGILEPLWVEDLIDQPWWWSALERIPLKAHEGWLKRHLKTIAKPGRGRHLLLIGKPI